MNFGFATTAAEAVAGIDLSGRRAIVTGGASGIGIPTSRALASAGAHVTLAVRNTDAARGLADDIGADVRRLDLADLDSVDAFTRGWDGPLHILVNNAGIMATPELELSPEGFELQFATNHLGHFALATGLHGALAAEGARIVSVSSRAHLRSPVVFDDINFAFREYAPFLGYGQSKTANVLFAVGATARWARDGIFANALMPGGIATNLQRHMAPDYLDRVRESGFQLKSPEQGAATSVYVATSPDLEGIGGRYYEDVAEAPVLDRREEAGVARYALDPDNAERLWALSQAAVRRQVTV
ncbi:NAD(P)-dependent dehydrogenase (short-subunit alcohol dehydrogenase family) [Solirubrobacter pauli]|uniref:Probable oxidoreductase n=1 Tax=Solirubrobacter pauli TaxID=166793 RepID=A0A660L0D4_9ACTN|nr:SDR family NAD(P)-dependent oxidoreductase [Solirubrobacter pauli]RKQ86369.1 NAD(P)-dependent dehydrogenase (short-subunit alcohol dehydrogenase family) [Solirubrobacter pauli]